MTSFYYFTCLPRREHINLDMEVLFDIYGYNGEVFQRLALDLFKLARDANSKEKGFDSDILRRLRQKLICFLQKQKKLLKEKYY